MLANAWWADTINIPLLLVSARFKLASSSRFTARSVFYTCVFVHVVQRRLSFLKCPLFVLNVGPVCEVCCRNAWVQT